MMRRRIIVLASMRRRFTLMRTFLDLKSLWAIAGFKPSPLLAPSSPGMPRVRWLQESDSKK